MTKDSGRVPLYEENEDFVCEEHILSFAEALAWDGDDEPGGENGGGDAGQKDWRSGDEGGIDGLGKEGDKGGDKEGHKRRPELIRSKSDWFSINSRPFSKKWKRDGLRSQTVENEGNTGKMLANEFRSSVSYTVLRWPILIFVLIWILFLCLLYTIVRAYVALSEYFFTWRGERKRLRSKLRSSNTYEEWIANALELDRFLNLDKWSLNPKFSYYNYKLIALTIPKLRYHRERDAVEELMTILLGCLKKNFAGIDNRQLYSHRYYGTKDLVHEYIEEVDLCINKVIDSDRVSFKMKRKFFRIVLRNFGKAALCLSGGACFAYTHFGIVRALLDNDLLPSIVSGTSGGGLIAALACTRTDEELKKLLVPQLARKITACEDPWYIWIKRWWKTGAMFDSVVWARKSNFFTRGSMTFTEAYQRSGRMLNISTVPADPHSPAILCNTTTSPQCVIWSTLLASSAVPGILNPVVLLQKDPNDDSKVIPFSLGNKWKDGSLRTDIPIDALNTYYNVSFTIVSQVNPHILLFFFAPKGTVGRPVAIPRRKTLKEKYAHLRGGFIAAALELLFRLEITKWLRIIKSLDLLPHIFEQDWLNVWLQKFSGSITIWPRNKLKDFIYILADPTEERLAEMIKKGERSMFPKLLFIKHRLTIERSIEKGRKLTKLSTKLQSTKSQFYNESVFNDFDIHNVDYADDDDDSDSSDDEVFERNMLAQSRRSKKGPRTDESLADSLPNFSDKSVDTFANLHSSNPTSAGINDDDEDDFDDEDLDDDYILSSSEDERKDTLKSKKPFSSENPHQGLFHIFNTRLEPKKRLYRNDQ